jgi:hypothetical protein
MAVPSPTEGGAASAVVAMTIANEAVKAMIPKSFVARVMVLVLCGLRALSLEIP